VAPRDADVREYLDRKPAGASFDMRFSRSLKGRLTIIVATAIVTTGVIVVLFGYFMARSILSDKVYQSLEAVVGHASRVVSAEADLLKFQAEALGSSGIMSRELAAYDPSSAGDRESAAIPDILARQVDEEPGLIGATVYLPDGTVAASYSGNGAGKAADIPKEAIEPAALDFTVEGGNFFLLASEPVVGVDNELLGTVVVERDAQDLLGHLSVTPGLGSTGAITLSKKEGGAVAAATTPPGDGSRRSTEERELDPSGDSPPVEAAEGKNGEGRAEGPGGKSQAVSYGYIPELDWGVTAATDASEAFAPLARLRNVVLLVLLVLLFGGVALAYLIARSIARPLEELQEGVENLAGGDFTTHVVTDGGTEVTALAEEFNRMAVRLRDLYQNLENKVDERTSELREANERLKELDSLKNEFVSIASHELRSPMASMKMGVSTVHNELVGPLNDEQKLMLSIADRNIDRLTKLTSNILDLTKIEAGKLDLELGACDVTGITAEVVRAEKPAAEHAGLGLVMEEPDGPCITECDGDRVYQVIQNLLGNAVKFTESGGITVRVARRDGFISVSVTDTGPGIPPEVLDGVFDKWSPAFTETRSEKRGSGLGLAISKGIVEAHGGEIQVENRPGGGAEFQFTIPVTGEDEEDPDS
jgi:signal transduction histidine kinase